MGMRDTVHDDELSIGLVDTDPESDLVFAPTSDFGMSTSHIPRHGNVSHERELFRREVEVERRALHAEFTSERIALKKECLQLNRTAKQQRQQLPTDRGMEGDSDRLREQLEEVKKELRQKETRWQKTIDRLQHQIYDHDGKNRKLQEELKRAKQ